MKQYHRSEQAKQTGGYLSLYQNPDIPLKKNIFTLLILLSAVWSKAAKTITWYPSINSIGYCFVFDPIHSDTLKPIVELYYGTTVDAPERAFQPSVFKAAGKITFRGSLLVLESNTKYYVRGRVLWGDGSADMIMLDSVTTKPDPLILATSNIKYVSPSGTGTQYTSANPGNLKVLLASGLGCGTTVLLKGGTYNTGDMQLNLSQDCDAANPIVIMAAPNEYPVIDGGDYTKYTWTQSTSDTNLYYTTIKPELEYNSLCLMDSTRLYPYGYLTPSSIDPSYPCLSNLNYDLSGFYRNANQVHIKTLDHKNPNNSNIVFSKYFYCLQVQGNNHQGFVQIKGIEFRNFGKGNCTKDIFGNPTCYPSFTVDFENTGNVIIDSCRFEYCNIPLTFGHKSDNNIIQNCTFIDGVGTWSHAAFKQTRDAHFVERGTYGRYLEYSSIHLFPDDTFQRGNIIRNNFVKGSIGGLVGERVTANERIEETDIYNNVVTYCYNGINADGGSFNTRIWNNTVDHCSVGLSFISGSGGPNFITRNCIHHIIERKNHHNDIYFMDCNNVLSSKIWGTGVKLNASAVTKDPPDMFFINNTFHTEDTIGFCMYLWNHTWQKLYSRNNIFYSEGKSSFFFDGPKDDSVYSFNSAYDCYFNKANGKAAIVQPVNGVPACNSYATGSALGAGLKTISRAKDVAVTNDLNIDPGFLNAAFDYHLKNTSPMVDAGVKVDGFTTQYRGSAPDIGAYEADTGAVGIKRIERIEQSLTLYPNPADNLLTIETSNGSGIIGTYIVFDMLGRVCFHGSLEGKRTTVNIAELLPGVYFVKVGDEARKFVKL
jgi:hypothetical protein